MAVLTVLHAVFGFDRFFFFGFDRFFFFGFLVFGNFFLRFCVRQEHVRS